MLSSLVSALLLASHVLAASQYGRASDVAKAVVHIPLDSYFNNQGIGLVPGEAKFDLQNNSYPAQYLPQNTTYTSKKTGISYLFPGYQGKNDNVIMSGQTITVPASTYFSIQMLASSDTSATFANMTFNYTDGTSQIAEIRTSPIYTPLSIVVGEIVLPNYFTPNKTNGNSSHIFEYIGALDPTRTLASIDFPDTSNATARIHAFSLSLWKQTGVNVQFVRPTQKNSSAMVQTVEVLINNAGPEWISGDGVAVSVTGAGIETVSPGFIKRLRPGDQRKIDVEVMGSGNVSAEVHLTGSFNATFAVGTLKFGLEEYTSDLESLALHETPNWFKQAKYGIFIHWGPYAVPGWGNVSTAEVYAEWYWWYGHHRVADRANIYDYHLETYGPDVVYDDFFANFTAELWDPKEWVDLFADAGAQYFVFTTKHHDGFAMFDSQNTTNRNSIQYGPKRDILKELFDAAKEYQPDLHRGTYFSLPEWFNPLYGPYGMAETTKPTSTSWPGIIANNPYTGEVEPYTGAINKTDFIADLMVPQMEILAYEYDTEIMWCDCGGANGTAEFAAAWYNAAAASGRQVTMNNRCGISSNDFDTPEYATFTSVSERSWESSQGMDPYSYGYNRATPDEAYMNATTLIHTLVDIVSKNGNLLLDIGPKADGTIAAPEVKTLREAGAWIKANAEAVFNTTYWFIAAEADNLRFTQTEDAFYIISLTEPVESLVVSVPVPVLDGDVISMLGAGNNTEVAWIQDGEDLVVTVPSSLAKAGEYAWVFKVTYSA